MAGEPTFYHDPDGRKWAERERRIAEMMEEAGETGVANRLYWELVYDNEEAPLTTDAEELKRAGFELPAEATLSDAALALKLRELIDELARMRVYLTSTDHLTDRDLYRVLTESLLLEERHDVPMAPGSAWHLDVLGGWSDEDRLVYLQYYADEGERDEAADEGTEVPPRRRRPANRDASLPRPPAPPPFVMKASG